MDMGESCVFEAKVPLKAKAEAGRFNPRLNGLYGAGGVTVENPRQLKANRSVEPFVLSMFCYDDSERIVGGGATHFDTKTGKWVRDVEHRIQEMGGISATVPNERRDFDRSIRFYGLSSNNAEGYAITEDDQSGEEKFRQRRLTFCIVRHPRAVCGQGDMGMLREGHKADLTPYALQILRSIEWLDDAPGLSVPSPASQASAGQR